LVRAKEPTHVETILCYQDPAPHLEQELYRAAPCFLKSIFPNTKFINAHMDGTANKTLKKLGELLDDGNA